MSDPSVVVVPPVPLAEGLPLAGRQQGELGGVGVDEAAPALQRGRRGAAVFQLANVGYHHFSASLRASNNGNGITCADVASGPAGPSLSSLSPAGPGAGRGHSGAAVAAVRPPAPPGRAERVRSAALPRRAWLCP